ncbi:MAG: TorF family putative porin, partial [Gemmobacter sp.]
MHNPTLAAAVLALAAAFPVSGRAEGVTLTFGATIASEYESNGLRQSNGIAFQPSVEAEYRGFYAGIWASNVDQAIIGPGDTFEYDLYAGYRNTVGAFSYDLSYAHYFYNGSGACCGE